MKRCLRFIALMCVGFFIVTSPSRASSQISFREALINSDKNGYLISLDRLATAIHKYQDIVNKIDQRSDDGFEGVVSDMVKLCSCVVSPKICAAVLLEFDELISRLDENHTVKAYINRHGFKTAMFLVGCELKILGNKEFWIKHADISIDQLEFLVLCFYQNVSLFWPDIQERILYPKNHKQGYLLLDD